MINKKKIAVVIKTDWEYDDRLAKECISLSKFANVHLFINSSQNKETSGVTDYGVPYKSFHLKTRRWLPQSKLLIIKIIDFFLRVRNYLNEYDIIWAHEEATFTIPIFFGKKCLWDLHEIPENFNNLFGKLLFHLIENRSKKIIHANNLIQYA